MTSIDPSRRSAALLRKKLEGRRSLGEGKSPAERGAHAAADLLALRIQAIDAADPQGARKAVRIYLEAQLAREFGSEVVNDPLFAQLVDSVQAQMQEDAELATAMQRAGELLMRQGPVR